MLDYSKTAYLDDLWSQNCSIFSYIKFIEEAFSDSHRQDPEICDWVNAILGRHGMNSNSRKVTIERLGNSKFITEGYKKYHEHAVYQHHSLRSGSFVNSLAQGLRKLSLLNSVQVQSHWPALLSDGSPLARNWNPVHTYPAIWAWQEDPMTLACAKPDGIGHYLIIVSALVRAQIKIRNLSIADIPAEIFNRSDHSKPSVLGLDIVAFAGLERLSLSMASWCAGDGDQETCEKCPNIDGLRIMLSSMTRLKTLYLCLPSANDDFYEYDQVFPNDTIWTQLEILYLSSLSSKATDLLDLLTFQMPKLQHLTFGLMNLSDGIWEGFIECLKQYSKLSNFIIRSYESLYYNDGMKFTNPRHDDKYLDERQLRSWHREISHYVQHGGRHPSLMPDQPDSAAENFAEDLKPLLRCCGSSQPTQIVDAC